MDYMLAFDISPNTSSMEEQMSRIIAIAEKTQSNVGGGNDDRQGEYYLEASSRFEQTHLLEIVAILLPHATSLTIQPVVPVKKTRRQGAAISTKRVNRNGHKPNGAALAQKMRKKREKA